MKRTLLTVIITFFSLLNLDAQKWDWARYGKGLHADSKGTQVCVDNQNNVFVTGTSSDSISFGSYSLAAGNFLVKYDADGGVIKAINIDHGADEMFNDEDGNLIMYGGYHTNMYIGHHNEFTVTARYYSNLFIVKYDNNCSLKWIKGYCGGMWPGKAAGSLNQSMGSVACDKSGNLYLGFQSMKDTVYFDEQMYVKSHYRNSFFLSKINPNGQTVWINNGLYINDTMYFSGVRTVAVDNRNRLVIAGAAVNAPPNEDAEKYMMAVCDTGGHVLSYKLGGSTYNRRVHSEVFDGLDNHFSIGEGGNHPDLGFLTMGDTLFNAKWGYYLGGEYQCYGVGNVITDGFGNAYLSGGMYYQSGFGGCGTEGWVNAYGTWFQVKGYDILLAKIDSTGIRWLKTAGGDGYDASYDMYVTPGGECYVTGAYSYPTYTWMPELSGPIHFDDEMLPANPNGLGTMFVAKLGADDVSLKENIQVFNSPPIVHPNPSTDNIFLTDDVKDYRIYNSQGIVVSQGIYSPAGINILSQAPGLYFIEFSDGKRRAREKFLIE